MVPDQPLENLLENPAPIDPADVAKAGAYTSLFKDLQSNILTPHGLEEASYFFLKFDGAVSANPRTKYWLGMLALDAEERAAQAGSGESQGTAELVDALSRAPGLRVVSEHEVYSRRRLKSESMYSLAVNVLFARSGLEKLGLVFPPSQAFAEGMARRGELLNDPPSSSWEEGYRVLSWNENSFDALIIIAHAPAGTTKEPTAVQDVLDTFRRMAALTATKIVREEHGAMLKGMGADKKPYHIEAFGFRDGLSQPAFYESDRAYQEELQMTGKKWQSFAPLSLVLCRDPNGKTPNACGTFFVYRKLEQNIERFYEQSVLLAAKLPGVTPKEVRARLVGREPRGAPLGSPADAPSTLNNFDFTDDVKGEVCPFHAHVRKMNPRGDMRQDWGPKEHRIVRRAMPYGPKIQRDESGAPVNGRVTYLCEEDAGKPIGLLFLCAQSSIEQGFEHLQVRWANKSDHPRGRPWGQDALIGQGGINHVALDPNEPKTTQLDRVVTLRGGGYFFAPSIGCLRGLLGS